jgi:hypothetical protein
MNSGPAALLAFVFVAAIVYLTMLHKQIGATDTRMRAAPDTIDNLVSASVVPGNMNGPGATSNSGFYTANALPGV